MVQVQDVTIDFDYTSLRYPPVVRELVHTRASQDTSFSAHEGHDGKVELRDGQTVLSRIDTGLKDEIVGMSFNKDGTILAICSVRQLALFATDPSTGEASLMGKYRPYTLKDDLLGRILGLEDSIPRLMNGVVTSPDGTKVAIGIQNSWDFITSMQPGYGIVRVIDTSSMKQVSEHLVADSPRGLRFSDDGSELVINVKGRGEHRVK